MRTERFIAAAALVVAAFVAAPAAEAITQGAVTETQSGIKNCYYYYGGRHWRYRWHGGYYNYYWHRRYYRWHYHCHRYGWCYR